jgi:hypothetical protein
MMRKISFTAATLTWVNAIILTTLMASSVCARPIPAFPGAEGYGSLTRGGRGGKVIAVMNLNDSGSGSLRAAVEAEGPRIVVFRVSGTIQLKSSLRIRHPYITIAGQTAPGDGICLRGQPLVIGADEVIIRYIRVRLGDESASGVDAVEARYNRNIILDHVSASWGSDEVLSVYHGEYTTVQNCIILEAIGNGTSHKFAGIWGCNYSTYHHNYCDPANNVNTLTADSFNPPHENSEDGSIRPYSKNRWYWQYKGEPVVLIGGSDDDNLFQWTGGQLTDHLDLLVSVGGNYVRNTMSDRDDGNVYAFMRLDNGLYDLDQWNDEYWDRFEFFFNETEKRGIIVQLTLWDQFDLGSRQWREHPWNPENNVNRGADA